MTLNGEVWSETNPHQQMRVRLGTYKKFGNWRGLANFVKKCKCEGLIRKKWHCERKIENKM